MTTKNHQMRNKRLLIILSLASILLIVPFVAMQFTDEVNWRIADFISMGALLFGTGLSVEFVCRKVSSIKYRMLYLGIALLVFLLIWAELAVGVFRSPFAGS